ncbi:type II toxin-antitoxin system RelE/ParE family toxin [Pseudonocardia sp.]|uniref:type II toxin-antitoxin system RelE/ParE family toxin n=1 Tax=Pseudonocardia sp. TaxID=60912 RepID=UPI003D0D7210
MWEVYLTDEVDQWLDDLAARDPGSHRQAVFAIEALVEGGPNLGRPLVDRIKGSSIHNLKELRPGSSGTTEMRILFAFDPWRSSVLLVAGDKSGRWREWYRQAIPLAEQLYETYLKERATKEGR